MGGGGSTGPALIAMRHAPSPALQRRVAQAAAAAWSGAPQPRAVGLDVSTRFTGVAVVSPTALLHHELLPVGPREGTFAYGRRIALRVASLKAEHGATCVGVEDFVKSFAAGGFRTQDLFKLSRLNGIVGYASWAATEGTVPIGFHLPGVARSYFGIERPRAVRAPRIGKPVPATPAGASLPALSAPAAGVSASLEVGGTFDVKHAVWDFVATTFPSFRASLEVTRTGKPRPTNFDRSDAVLVAMYATAMHVEDAVLTMDAGALFVEYVRELAAAAAGLSRQRAVALSADAAVLCHHQWMEQRAEAHDAASFDVGDAAEPAITRQRRAAAGAANATSAAAYTVLRKSFSRWLRRELPFGDTKTT